MAKRRIERLNSLLKEVISDIIRDDVKDPHLPSLITITQVDVTDDIRYAKVHTSVIGTDQERETALKVLNRAAGFIAERASRDVVLRYFPDLKFVLDDSVDHQVRIEEVIQKIHEEEDKRLPHD